MRSSYLYVIAAVFVCMMFSLVLPISAEVKPRNGIQRRIQLMKSTREGIFKIIGDAKLALYVEGHKPTDRRPWS